MISKLIKFNAWYAMACGVFCLLVAPMIVDSALLSLGARPERAAQDETYLLAVSFVRIVGILLFVYAMTIRLLLKQNFDPQDIRGFFALWSVGLLSWGGMFLFVIFTKSAILASVSGIGLLEWLLIPAVLLFTYKSPTN